MQIQNCQKNVRCNKLWENKVKGVGAKNPEHSDKPGDMNTEYDEPINLRRTWTSQDVQNARYLP